MSLPFKLKKLNIKKIGKILHDLDNKSTICYQDFIVLIYPWHKVLDLIRIEIIDSTPALRVSIRNSESEEFITIPVTLVTDDTSTYDKFLEHWELFRINWKYIHNFEELTYPPNMIEMNISNFNRFVELTQLGLIKSAESFLVCRPPEQISNVSMIIHTYNGSLTAVSVFSTDENKEKEDKVFNIHVDNPEQFINEWNEFREKYFINKG